MAKVPQRYLDVDPWIVRETGFHPERELVSESIFSLGNEFMGVRGYFEEGYSGATILGSFFNGIFEDKPIVQPVAFKGMSKRSHFLLNSVDWLYTRIRVGREKLDLATSKFTDFERSLDLRTGVLVRSFVWQVDARRHLRVRFERFTSMDNAHLGAQRIVLEALDFAGPVEVRMGLDFSPTQYIHDKVHMWPTIAKRAAGKSLGILGQTRITRHRVLAALQLRTPADAVVHPIDLPLLTGRRMTLRLKRGQPATFDRLVSTITEKDPKVPDSRLWKRLFDETRKAGKLSYETALAKHSAYWEHQWSRLDVTIDGDPENQQGVRFGIFNLHQTYHGVDPELNVSAKGLTGEFYEGHTWWDTETYCLPFYLFNNPAAARNLLGYRFRRLPQACERARQKDCEGARYPMDSIDGTESCRAWQHGDLEIHVSAAVAFGVWHYVNVTQDKDFLHTEGIEMLLQISRYYASRGQWSPLTGEFGFWCVMGADEFHMMVHNNTYTNVMAKKGFEYTLRVLAEMKRQAPERLAKVIKRVGLRDEEPGNWRRMAAKMRVSRDAKTGVYEQHDGFFDMPHIDVDSIPPTDFPLYHNWAYFRIFRWDMIKQPDVLLLHFLYSGDYGLEDKRVNFEYYEPRCSHESSLSPGIHSILAAELGKHDMAYQYWGHAARLDLDDYNRNTYEGLHTTSMAAAWMNVVYGFGGMRTDGPLLAFAPTIPKPWKAFSFRVLHGGATLEVQVNKREAHFRVTEGKAFSITVYGAKCRVTPAGFSVLLPPDRVG